MHFDEIDWPRWQAKDLATLVFVLNGPEVLLIRKKRGLGAGKINAPGGRFEPDETGEECARRELNEEVGLVAGPLEWCGENLFQFSDGYSIHVQVYRTSTFSGELVETDEAIPYWFQQSEIPYDEMWEDDRIWVPRVFRGEPFRGQYLFDGDKMAGHRVEPISLGVKLADLSSR